MSKEHRKPKVLSVERANVGQRSSIASQIIDNCNDDYLLCNLLTLGFLVEPALDLRKVQRAFDRLAQRHESLRQTFSKVRDDWKVAIWDQHRTGITIEDYGDVCDKTFNTTINSLAQNIIRIEEDDPFQVSILRFGKRGDVLLIRADHCNVDGHSLIILAEEFIKLLIGLPLFGKPLTHRAYLDRFESPSPAKAARFDAYWRSILYPVLPSPGSGKLGTNHLFPRRCFDTSNFRSRSYSISQSQYDDLKDRAAKHGLTPYGLMFGAFSKSYLQVSGLTGVYLLAAVDRTHNELSHQVACLTGSIPIRCEFDPNEDVVEISGSLANQLATSMEHLPSDVMLPELHYDHEVYEAGGVLKSIYCAMVSPDTRMKKSPFAKSFYGPPGEKQSVGPLKITKLKLPSQSRSSASLSFLITPMEAGAAIRVGYQSHLYLENDIDALLDRVAHNAAITFIPDSDKGN